MMMNACILKQVASPIKKPEEKKKKQWKFQRKFFCEKFISRFALKLSFDVFMKAFELCLLLLIAVKTQVF